MLRAQGAFSASSRGCWRLGWLGWQDSTFTFHGSGRSVAVKIDLAAITALDRERRTFILVSKHVLRLTYQPAGAARRRCERRGPKGGEQSRIGARGRARAG